MKDIYGGEFRKIRFSGLQLKQMREKAELTQKQFAELCGLQYQAIQRYEYGEVVPSIETAFLMAMVLDTNPSYFME